MIICTCSLCCSIMSLKVANPHTMVMKDKASASYKFVTLIPNQAQNARNDYIDQMTHLRFLLYAGM